ncbi:putative uncharacterized protein ZNRD1-AS1 [Erinaceus europaeus]|uniref:Uncharacterized protein n=1 Tax=Erinaceus europaeus TaxID=9365 RepID=A0ABM3XIH2_ERIEU|nr:putative uncharacterized protein ZNRD1-AS1 [Erinaceus europaeus]
MKPIAREPQPDKKSVQRLQDKSSSLQLAQSEAQYHLRQQRLEAYLQNQLQLPQGMGETLYPPGEEEHWRPPCPGPRTEDYECLGCPIPDRELGHIQRHIYWAEQARGLRGKQQRWAVQDIPSELWAPQSAAAEGKWKVITEEQMASRRSSRQRMAWVAEQIKGHQDRMLRGRRLSEKRRAEREALRTPSQVPPVRTQPGGRRNTAFPITRPLWTPGIKVPRLRATSPEEELLEWPFLRSQVVQFRA